ncbi:fimbria/pilus periplasmic chaperone, partial [Escherichia coli]|nr:fimbria/pilus periplasmic chaperone [Escherichia coli]
MFFLKRIVFIIFTISAYPVSANVVITGTRVIYPAGQHNVNVQLTNVGISPSLIQAWIDNGDPKAAPETIKTPFVITPPIARIDGNKGQTLRLSYTGEPLPADRESVFYLNVLDIPPNPRDKNKNYLQIAIRSRIKIFFR